MIYGIGIDMSEIDRFDKLKSYKRFLPRFFHEEEIAEFKKKNFASQSLCASFCAKEAFSKAIGTGIKGFSLRDVCTLHDISGKPYIKLYGGAEEAVKLLKLSFEVSITHTKEHAAAVVIAFRGD